MRSQPQAWQRDNRHAKAQEHLTPSLIWQAGPNLFPNCLCLPCPKKREISTSMVFVPLVRSMGSVSCARRFSVFASAIPPYHLKQAIEVLKENFPSFQPSLNRFYPSPGGIQAGEIVLIDSSTPGGPVSTGVMILYADERSFTFNTPQGHPECGFVSFSAHEESEGTLVQIFGLARASDPVYEAAFRLVGSRIQTRIWTHVLTSLALYFGVPVDITLDQECVDTRLRWSQIGNVYYKCPDQNSDPRTKAMVQAQLVDRSGGRPNAVSIRIRRRRGGLWS